MLDKQFEGNQALTTKTCKRLASNVEKSKQKEKRYYQVLDGAKTKKKYKRRADETEKKRSLLDTRSGHSTSLKGETPTEERKKKREKGKNYTAIKTTSKGEK